MAWIYKCAGSENWFIGFRVAGRLQAKSTRTPDRAEAERQLAACEALQRNASAGSPLDAIHDALRQASGQGVINRSLKAELDEWVAEARKTTAPATAERYAGIAASFAASMNATDAKPLLREVSSEHVRKYLGEILTRKSVATANQERRCLRVFWRRAMANGRVGADAVATVKPFRNTQDVKRRPFTLEEVRLLISSADEFWRFAIVTGFYTGLRISDIAQMPIGAVDLKQGLIRLSTQKTGTHVTLPIPTDLANLIRARLTELGQRAKPEDFLWPEYAAMRSGQRSNQFHTLLVQCGLAEARSHKATKKGRDVEREASTVSFHCLRHAFVSNLKAAGAGQAVARALAGHSSDAMSDHYTSIPIETLRDAVEKLPSLV